MKSIKQSRIDRLARRAKREKKEEKRQANLTKNQRILLENKFLKKIEKALLREGNKRCPHGLPFSGYECFSCRPAEIANRLREEWLPATKYNVEVIPVNSEAVYIPVTVRTNNLTDTVRDMQKNGFWYCIHDEPMYLMPQSIRCIIVKGMAQNRGYIDPSEKPDPKEPDKTRHAER